MDYLFYFYHSNLLNSKFKSISNLNNKVVIVGPHNKGVPFIEIGSTVIIS